uniref:Uncharacterized protein n=1 Tax=Laticauda laticaudata TaxID=8630 RepID=A0A8C5WRA1_LATLA
IEFFIERDVILMELGVPLTLFLLLYSRGSFMTCGLQLPEFPWLAVEVHNTFYEHTASANLKVTFPLFLQKFEDYVSYWSNVGCVGHEYNGGYYHHHYDEDAPIGPRNPGTFRHGANVNYDDYY